MVAIPFPLTSSPGRRSHESAGRLLNCYHERLVGGARAENVWRRAPGLRAFATSTQTGPRGAIPVGSNLYSAFSGNVSRFDSAGTRTNVGALAGTANVFWARNNNAPNPDVVVVDPENGAFVVTSSAVSAYPDVDVGSPNSVCFLDGYFFFTYGDGTCQPSSLNSTDISILDDIKCEGKPDGLLRAVPFEDLYLAGTDSIEIFHNTAEPSPGFPFSRLKVIPKGIIGRNAVSGYEDGIGKVFAFVGNDRRVHILNGYTPQAISTSDVDDAISDFIEAGGDADDIKLFPYVIGSHACIVMRSPTWTWVFDLDTLHWHERASYLSSTWRVSGSTFAFGKWIGHDATDGDLVEISRYARDELGDPLTYLIESGPVTGFPNKVAVAQAVFDVAQGVGIATGTDPVQTDPKVEISYTDDGYKWTDPRIRKLGRQNEVDGSIKLVKCGTTKAAGRRWRLQVDAAVDVELAGGDQSATLKRA